MTARPEPARVAPPPTTRFTSLRSRPTTSDQAAPLSPLPFSPARPHPHPTRHLLSHHPLPDSSARIVPTRFRPDLPPQAAPSPALPDKPRRSRSLRFASLHIPSDVSTPIASCRPHPASDLSCHPRSHQPHPDDPCLVASIPLTSRPLPSRHLTSPPPSSDFPSRIDSSQPRPDYSVRLFTPLIKPDTSSQRLSNQPEPIPTHQILSPRFGSTPIRLLRPSRPRPFLLDMSSPPGPPLSDNPLHLSFGSIRIRRVHPFHNHPSRIRLTT